MHLAGFTERELRPAECRQLLAYGFGLATAVCRPTASASELSENEYADALGGLVQRLDRFRPRHIAFLGKDAYATMSHQKHIRWGRQSQPLCASSVWLLPNPSGRNRSFSLADLVEAYREFRVEITG